MQKLAPHLWSTAKKAALRMGVVAQRSSLYSRPELRLAHYLRIQNVDTVLDVGANRGSFAHDLIVNGYQGTIVSFEAIPGLHQTLTERAAAHDNWIVAPRCAISEAIGEATFHINLAQATSSLMSPSEKASELPDLFTQTEAVTVPTQTISAFMETSQSIGERVFLKLDIQGGEYNALQGAEAALPRIMGIVVELPLQEYYSEQASHKTIDTWITSRGFELWDIEPEWRHPETGRLVHFNATYFRTNET